MAHNGGKHMEKDRLAAFSDGVIAIIITIMVLELHPPHDSSLAALFGLWPTFLSYALSFIYVAIYWNNHHHLLHTVTRVSGAILWANMHLLFWLSLVPFTTSWLNETDGGPWPAALYGASLLAPALAYYLLQSMIVKAHGPDAMLAQAIGKDWKGKLSPLIYVAGIGACFADPRLGLLAYVLVALIWLIPDRRIERALRGE